MQKPGDGRGLGNSDELTPLVEQANGRRRRRFAGRHIRRADIASVLGPFDPCLGQDHRRKSGQHAFEGHNCCDGAVAAAFGDVERDRVSEHQARTSRTPQAGQMGADAKADAQIVRQLPHVKPGGTR